MGRETAFLVGAGRSGTTLLYKLLCLHAEVAYISNYHSHAGWLLPGAISRFTAGRTGAKLNAWFNRGGNAYLVNRPWTKKFFPMPVEGESVYQKCGLPLFPRDDYEPGPKTRNCLRIRFERIRNAHGAQVMISKRTANNRRIKQLQSVFPGAKYIHLIRDGREVALSLSRVDWWPGHLVWWDGRTAAQMEQAGEARLAICAKNWVEEMAMVQVGLAEVAKNNVLEIRYEHLLADPIAQVESIAGFLGLSLTIEFRSAIESLQLSYHPGAWSGQWTTEQIAIVMREQEPLLRELGYLENDNSTTVPRLATPG